MPRKSNVILKDVEILPGGFRNFSGSPTPFNKDGGKRYFNIRLDEDLAKKFIDEGFSGIRDANAKRDDRDPLWIMNVAVRFEPVPCHIWIYSTVGNNRRLMRESNVSMLDWMDIETADIEIRPSWWENNGRNGYKPYCANLFITPVENELTTKYGNVPIVSDDDDDDMNRESDPDDTPF